MTSATFAPSRLRSGLFAVAAVIAAAAILGASRPPRVPGREAVVARGGWVKIGLQRGVGSVQFTIPGPAKVQAAGQAPFAVPADSVFTAAGGSGVVSVSAGGRVLASDSSVVIEPVPSSGPAGGSFQLSRGRYRGRLLLTARGGGIDVVNLIMIDDWLKGLVGAEIGGEAPLEALKAQAICARSEAVHKLGHPPHERDGFDFCTGVHCQAYKGMKDETPGTVKACQETAGLVVTGPDGAVMDGVYSNVCGGVTALPDDVWAGGPKPGFVARFDSPTDRRAPDLSGDAAMSQFLANPSPDTLCDPAGKPQYPAYARKYYRWTRTLTAGQLAGMGGVGRVRDIRVTERRPSGRVRKVTVTGDRGSRTIDKELNIRNAFGALPSGAFVLKTTTGADGGVESATFTGAGNGHGVGLCQHGARIAASLGGTAEKILLHYYPGARLERIYRP